MERAYIDKNRREFEIRRRWQSWTLPRLTPWDRRRKWTSQSGCSTWVIRDT